MTDKDYDEIIMSLTEIADQPTEDGTVDGVNQQAIKGALELLEEQEPRLMTLKDLSEAVDNVTVVEKYLRSIGESWYADIMSDTKDILNGFAEDINVPGNGWISVKDRMPIVRCKDCKYFDKGHAEDCHNLDSVCYSNGVCSPDWFCADGKRR